MIYKGGYVHPDAIRGRIEFQVMEDESNTLEYLENEVIEPVGLGANRIVASALVFFGECDTYGVSKRQSCFFTNGRPLSGVVHQ